MKRIALLMLTSLTLAFAGCSNDDDDSNTPSGPRDRDVEYRITTNISGATADIIYTNDTGGLTTLDNVTLPATYKFKRRLGPNDAVSILADLNSTAANSEVVGVILLDGQQVKTETGRGSTPRVNPIHVIQ